MFLYWIAYCPNKYVKKTDKTQSNNTKKQTNRDKKRQKKQEQGNIMHEETEIQKSEEAFHQKWEKWVINSASLRLAHSMLILISFSMPLLIQWCYPTSWVAKVTKTGKTTSGYSRHSLFCHNRILDITKSPAHYDKINPLNLCNWLISSKKNKRKEI